MRVLVVADDLTGANATGGRFARRGFATVTAAGASDRGTAGGASDRGTAAGASDRGTAAGASGEPPAAGFADFEVVLVSTGSRYADPAEAARRVTETVERWPADLVVKRIDTTLRGNLGAEVDAALDAVSRRAGRPVRALVVPAFPDAGRATVGGLQLVDGIELTATEAANDPHGQLGSSRVADLIAVQSRRSITEVTLASVLGGRLAETLREGAEIVVCDALDDRHLRVIARVAAQVAAEDGVAWLAVDPGPFGAELAAELDPREVDPVLVVAGSVTGVTRRQLDALEHRLDARLVAVEISDLSPAAVARRIATGGGEVVGLRTDVVVADVDVSRAHRITDTLGAVARAVVDARAVAGCYLTGGDVTAGVLAALGADGFEIDAEVMPLAVAGRIVGGPHAGLPVVTKGGLIGGDDAAVACVEHLRRLARRRVPAAGGGESPS